MEGKYNKIWKEMRGCGADMVIGEWPKYQLTLFSLGMLRMVLRSGTAQHFIQENKGG